MRSPPSRSVQSVRSWRPRVLGDDGIGGVEDGLRRAVVLFEQVDRAAGEVAFEVLDVADVGGAPRVDGLVGVADDGDVAGAARRAVARELVLRPGSCPGTRRRGRAGSGRRTSRACPATSQEAHGVQEEVVEVERELLRSAACRRRRRRARRPRRSSRGRSRRTLRRNNQLALGVRDAQRASSEA